LKKAFLEFCARIITGEVWKITEQTFCYAPTLAGWIGEGFQPLPAALIADIT